MNTVQKTAAFVLLLSLGVFSRAQNVKAQAVPKNGFMDKTGIPNNHTTKLPPVSVDYEGDVDINLPSVPTIHAHIRASKNIVRYDFNHPFLQIPVTMWADLNTGQSAKDNHIFGHHYSKPDTPLPGFANIEVKKIENNYKMDGQNLTVYHVDKGAVMPGHLFTGDIYVTEKGVVWLVQGRELNTAKCTNTFEPMTIRMLAGTYKEAKQDAALLTIPVLADRAPKAEPPHPNCAW